MKKRNSLIELYRFILSLNVVKSHSLFPVSSPYFTPGRVSVEFFFVLSGFFFSRTLDRLEDLPLRESLPKLLYSKVKPLFFPLVIGVLANTVFCFISFFRTGSIFEANIWGYLWYVPAMIVSMCIYLGLRRLFKSERSFYLFVLMVFAAATILRFSGLLYSWGYCRAFSTLSLGMLVSRLPKINIKRRGLLWLAVVPLALATFSVVALGLGNLSLGGFMWMEAILDLILYPALIYFSLQIDFSFPLFNYLGALSFGLYAFQCPADLLREIGVSDVRILFAVILGATLAEDFIKRIYRKIKNKRLQDAA